MNGSSDGISLAQSSEDGSLEIVGLAAALQSPTFLAAAGDHLYSVAEGSHRVVSYLRDGNELTLDGDAPSGGVWPCHLAVIDGGGIDGAVIAANYETGELGVFSVGSHGAIGELVQVLPGSGSGPLAAQAGPHAHASLQIDDVTVLSADLGADRILVHAIEGAGLRRTGEVALQPGTGPRDIARHPSGLIYVLGEHGKVVLVFEWVDGMLRLESSIPLPGAEPTDQAAALGFSTDGRFVYAGLRGSNQVAVLRASDDGRTLEPVGSVSTAGDWPRHLVVDGDVLHVANQRSNTIASFRLAGDGMPALIGTPTPIASPTYLLPVG